MARGAGDSVVDREARVEKKFLSKGNFLRGLRIPYFDTESIRIRERHLISPLIFMSIVAAIVIPVLLYNGYNEFRVFRGKTGEHFREDDREG